MEVNTPFMGNPGLESKIRLQTVYIAGADINMEI